MDCSLPGSSVREILRTRILEWIAISFSRASSRSRKNLWLLQWQAGSLPLAPPAAAAAAAAQSFQWCQTCDLIDCNPPGSSVYGILQAILEWVAIPSSRAPSPPRDRTWVSYFTALADGFFTTSTTWEAHSRLG